MIHTLETTLDALIASHEELLETAMEKQEAIIRNDIGSLNRLVQRENKLLKTILSQEAERATSARALFALLGIPDTQPATLANAVRFMNKAEDKKSLSRRRDRLLVLLESLRAQNERNQQLTEHALRYVNYSLDLLSYSPMDDVTYRPAMQSSGKNGNSLFDTRA
jgi:flagellar biosynthesis/type III secretory pathway chaperone